MQLSSLFWMKNNCSWFVYLLLVCIETKVVSCYAHIFVSGTWDPSHCEAGVSGQSWAELWSPGVDLVLCQCLNISYLSQCQDCHSVLTLAGLGQDSAVHWAAASGRYKVASRSAHLILSMQYTIGDPKQENLGTTTIWWHILNLHLN